MNQETINLIIVGLIGIIGPTLTSILSLLDSKRRRNWQIQDFHLTRSKEIVESRCQTISSGLYDCVKWAIEFQDAINKANHLSDLPEHFISPVFVLRKNIEIDAGGLDDNDLRKAIRSFFDYLLDIGNIIVDEKEKNLDILSPDFRDLVFNSVVKIINQYSKCIQILDKVRIFRPGELIMENNKKKSLSNKEIKNWIMKKYKWFIKKYNSIFFY